MPITVRYLNDDTQECAIRPTPLVSISTQHLKNKSGQSFQRLLALGRSGNEVLNSFEFPLGRIEGGAEMERSEEISLSSGLLGAVEPLELVIIDDLGNIIYELRTHLYLEYMLFL